ncbi:MAG: cytochrome C554 [candidate division Zixibacteria bacterium]|nr:cytochrome C554 [candidate division Zixibacteria bacterium]
MRKPILILVLVVVAAFFIFGFALSQEEKGTGEADTVKKEVAQEDTTQKEDTTKVVYKYVGNTWCKTCHNSEGKGKIWDKWASTKHATAYATLANQESKKIAKEMDIEDPQKDAKCLVCHVTGYGQPTTGKYSLEEGVSCEGCHGPGEVYYTKHGREKERELALKSGFVPQPDEELCVTCHNKKSPTYKEFKFKEVFTVIEHRTPEPEKK